MSTRVAVAAVVAVVVAFVAGNLTAPDAHDAAERERELQTQAYERILRTLEPLTAEQEARLDALERELRDELRDREATP